MWVVTQALRYQPGSSLLNLPGTSLHRKYLPEIVAVKAGNSVMQVTLPFVSD